MTIEKKKRKTTESKNIEIFSFNDDKNLPILNIKPVCEFSEGEIVKIKNTGELGIVTRTRIFGNSTIKNIIIKTQSNEKRIISVDELEKNNT